ncbi:hexokinase-3 isoform X2 [Manihot esculenta]|uniref:Uncharacterized protein n=1 Tax=Manihot esculenta TaxID=3983 RepID=A0ACB7GE96_MANES|nr:hexokinase-3 isoform X2 [Manihot esculenta]KAG8638326.1 hypothetical protein MANES_14G005400v8 [Manihot esculenta]
MGRVTVAVAMSVAVVACAVAGVVVGRRVRSRRKWSRVVGLLRELEESCETPVGRLRQVVDAMAVEMHAGLASEGGSKLKMLLTFVDHLPTGSEVGTYYALDLGGTNFRVIRVQLGGRRSSILSKDVELQPIPQHLMTSTSEDLFDFIASTLKQFIEKEENVSEFSSLRKRELGFTFSFPVKQMSIHSGILIKWTKGFAIDGMVGREVVEHLQAALSRNGLDVQVAVLVVNMEWGNFWSSHLPRTTYDINLDAESPNPNDQGFEKMISGLYLGEIVRRVILRMSQESDIFGPISPSLLVPFILHTPFVSKMHEDDSPNLQEVARILKLKLEIPEGPLKVRKLVVRICDVVTRRAARLAAAGIVGILKKIGRDGTGGITSLRGRSDMKMRRTVVAIEGGLYTSYAMFREYLHEALNEILGEDIAQHVILKATEDGSGLGAAILAASQSSYTVDSVQ